VMLFPYLPHAELYLEVSKMLHMHVMLLPAWKVSVLVHLCNNNSNNSSTSSSSSSKCIKKTLICVIYATVNMWCMKNKRVGQITCKCKMWRPCNYITQDTSSTFIFPTINWGLYTNLANPFIHSFQFFFNLQCSMCQRSTFKSFYWLFLKVLISKLVLYLQM
jgi:hypothetical protein